MRRGCVPFGRWRDFNIAQLTHGRFIVEQLSASGADVWIVKRRHFHALPTALANPEWHLGRLLADGAKARKSYSHFPLVRSTRQSGET
jgi:hypothetical protein